MGIFNQIDRALRHLREDRRTRQYQVAEAAGITKAMLSAYETGKQKPSLESLDKILEALGCDLLDLHYALTVYRQPRESKRGAAADELAPATPRSPADTPDLGFDAGGVCRSLAASPPPDVYSTLGIEERLGRDEEQALTQVLDGFHNLIRHLHDSARRSEDKSGESDAPSDDTSAAEND